MLDEWADFDKIKVGLIYYRRDTDAAAIPCHMELRMKLMDILRQLVNTFRVTVAAHECNAGDVGAILTYEIIDSVGVEWHADVFPEVMTMTPRAVTRAI